jgi:phytoene dehydrogenase-like protein
LRRRDAIVAGVLAATIAACGLVHPRPAARWLLVEPPSAEDPTAPAGVRIDPRAPLADWPVVARYTQATACELERQDRARRAIARAQAEAGDRAYLDPDVRRAVHTRCLRDPHDR